MAKIVENKKGFKVIEISREELLVKLSKYGSAGVCDTCTDRCDVGYYVAVLNRWLCKKCYDDFVEKIKRYATDCFIEDRNFAKYCKIFDLKI